MAYTQYFCRFSCCDLTCLIQPANFFKLFWHLHWRSAKFYSLFPCSRDSFCLSLADKFPLCLCNISKYLQHQICDQRSGKIPGFLSCIKQLHIQYQNICLYFFCDVLPLYQNVVVVASQPVDALYNQKTSFF